MQPTLLVLAAGMGSRYGGLKQIDGVGPSGETILDYAVFDAIHAGFGRVVFVIRKEFEEAFRTKIAAKYADRVRVDFVFQSLDALPAGFTPPPEPSASVTGCTRTACWNCCPNPGQSALSASSSRWAWAMRCGAPAILCANRSR